MRRGLFGFVLAASMLTVAALGAFADPPKKADPQKKTDAPGTPKASAKAFKPVQDVETMMEGQEKLFDDIRDGIIDKDWHAAEVSAWMLAEMGNVNHYQSDDPRYKKFADAMSAECVTLAKVIKKRDVKLARSAREKVQQRCKACHDVFDEDD